MTGTRTGVLYLIGSLGFGGLERRVLELVRRLDRDRFAPSVAVVEDEGELKPLYEATGVPIHPFPLRRLASLSSWGHFRRLGRFACSHGVRIVHGFSFYGSLYGALLTFVCPRLSLVTSEGGIGVKLEGRHQPLRYLYHRRSLKMLVNSASTRAYVEQIPDTRPGWLELIPNGVDTDRFDPRMVSPAPPADLGLPPAGPVVGHVGRLREEKGQLFLLDALEEVLRLRADTRVLLVGEGTHTGRIQERIAVPPFAGRTALVGFREDVRPFLRAMDIFVLPSQREGMSNALLEAMSMELACVATDVGGAPLMLDGGRIGRLVRYGDRPALAGALVELIDREDERRRLAAAGRRRVIERFSVERMVREYEAAYEAVLANAAR